MKQAKPKIFVLIDGKSLFYRGYYAMPHLSTADGRPTGGVYGFASLALELVRQLRPDYVAVAWDKAKTNIRRRRAIYPEYKANRHPAPPDFYQQIPILRQLLEALGWPFYEVDDYEADDIIGTLSKQANRAGIHTVIASSDLDMLQLIDDDTEVYALKKGLSSIDRFDVKAFQAKYGIRVDQFLDLKSLKGDSSDNIPGVPGVGEKTAVALLQKYHDLDGVYAHLDEITGAAQRKLADGKTSAYMSRELVQIQCDAPIPLDLQAADVNKLDRQKLRRLLLDLQFTSLLRRLPADMQVSEGDEMAGAETAIEPAVEFHATSLPDKLTGTVMVVPAEDGLLLSDQPGQYYKTSYKLAAELLTAVPVVAYDLKELASRFLRRNLPVRFVASYDVGHAGFLVGSLSKPRTLADILAELPDQSESRRLAVVYQLWQQTRWQLNQLPQLAQLASRVDFPLQLVLARMEERGVLADRAQLTRLHQKLGDGLALLEQAIWREVGYEFNVASPAQLSEALFTKLALKPTARKNKRGSYPTGAKELAKLRSAHPVIDLIIKYRELAKLKTGYADTLPKLIALDGRIHTTFSQSITATGRLSSSNPNMQNIPARTEQGREIKRAFIAPAGRVLVNADYAQFELRLAAALAGDQALIRVFDDPTNDVHTMTAAEAYGITPAEVTPEQRRHAKVINFGILYGMSPHGLAEATDMNLSEAREFIDKYFRARQSVRDYQAKVIERAKEDGYVQTLLGRRRPVPGLRSSNAMVREATKRAAINLPVQGTEADLMKMAMLKVEEIAGASQIMQVHDSIMVECDEAEAERIAGEMKRIMEQIYPELGVRLMVETKIGHDWSQL
ncbi:DNA polymerase [Candidatus Nanoperiomorbus periodonticus]|uniref:DNA polymerase n=1 Tax=Candidatus Nanoperiomorbus periodonticus TaxID=2171989 RepID=UPI0013EA6C6F|nr:DNA polymerase [Candidatus Nanoperiomorbus periodonticus]